MKLRPRRALMALTAALLMALAVATSAQANTQLPGINGKIAFTSVRDFPTVEDFSQKALVPLLCNERRGTDQGCPQEIYSMDPTGANQTRLTNNLDDDDEAAWLPFDGARIAFDSNRQGAETCDGDCLPQIWTMGNDGSSPFQVTHGQDLPSHPSYSPDGSKIAYAGLLQDEQSPGARSVVLAELIELFPTEIYIVPSGGGAVTPLLPAGQVGLINNNEIAFDSFPAWSPDGTQIAFTRLSITEGPNKGGTGGVDVRTWVAPADGSGNAHPVETYPPCPTSSSVATLADTATAFVNRGLDGLRSAMPRLAPGCTLDVKPAWSPDGNRIAATRITIAPQPPPPPPPVRGTPAGQDLGDIAVFNTDGSGDTNLSDLSEPAGCGSNLQAESCSIDEYPSWSPDGTKIAFDAIRGPDGTIPECSPDNPCDNEIWTMNADGSTLAQLTNNSADDFFPDWQRIPPPVPAQPAAPSPVKPKVGVAGVRRACVASRFHVRFRVSTANSSVKSVVVKLDGHRIKSTKKGSFTLTINGKKLKAGKHRLTITATNAAGQVTTTRKTFSVCKAAKPRRKAAPRFTG